MPFIISGGIGFFEVGNEGTNQQYAAKSTHILGGHSIKYGVLYEDIKYDNVIDRTGPSFTLADGTQTTTGATLRIIPDPVFGQIYRVNRANTSNVRETTQEYFSFFAQDTWQVGNRLTIMPGIRYEQQKLVGNLAKFQWDGNWAARIGGTFDFTGTGRSKLYANWGRFYAKIPNDLAARALSADAGVTLADYFDAALTSPIPDGVLAGNVTQHLVTAGLSPADFDPDSKSTYMDEFLVGAEYRFSRESTSGLDTSTGPSAGFSKTSGPRPWWRTSSRKIWEASSTSSRTPATIRPSTFRSTAPALKIPSTTTTRSR